jgi:hypothetical protein
MKKSLVVLVVLAVTLAFAGAAFAAGASCGPVCPAKPVKPAKCPATATITETFTKTVSSDTVLCKGAAKGKEKLCGPCAPTIKWSCSWATLEKGPTKTCTYVVSKKGKLLPAPKPEKEAPMCW